MPLGRGGKSLLPVLRETKGLLEQPLAKLRVGIPTGSSLSATIRGCHRQAGPMPSSPPDKAANIAGREDVSPQGSSANKSDFPTDKSRKQRSLRLTRGFGATVLPGIDVRGDILETRCHGANIAVPLVV